MKTVTFYSYKGGTGRSLSLVNTACALNATIGQNVGVVDLDCEAAAVEELFECAGKGNLLELLLPKNRNVSEIEKHILPFAVSPDRVPGIFILPTRTDSTLLGHINWDKGVEVFLRDELFPALEKFYGLDYLLIDSRAGLSDFAVFALRSADLVVVVCRLDRQNREGVKRMLQVYNAASKPYLVVVCGCPYAKRHAREIKQFSAAIGTPIDIVLPHETRLYFNEYISVKDKPRSSLSKGYVELARTIHQKMKIESTG